MGSIEENTDQMETDAPSGRRRRIGVLTLLTVASAVILVASIVLAVMRPPGRRGSVVRRIQALLPPPLGTLGQASRVVFGTSMSGIAKALVVYANDDDEGRLPPGGQWCDLIVGRDYTSPKQFVCRESDAIEGESSVAMNKNAAGKVLAGLPGDMVLLFETNSGRNRKGRKGLVKDRGFYKMLGNPKPLDGQTKVYKERWNQAGTSEIMDAWHHDGHMSVAFVGTRVKYIKKRDASNLKWKADPNE